MVKMNENAERMLDATLNTLELALEMASEKEDIDAIMAVSDRLLALFQYIMETDQGRKVKLGFHIAHKDTHHDEENNE